MDKEIIKEIRDKLSNIKEQKVLVIGDLAIDEMIYGDCERISREAPVLILQHSHTNIILGAASNAANNISALNDGKISVIGVCGNDYYSDILLQAFKKANIDTQYIVKSDDVKTIVKTRISGSCSQSITQQIVRIDRQTNKYISDETERQIIQNIEKALPDFDAVILSDYHICTLTDNIAKKTIELAKKYNKIVVADAQKNLNKYIGATAITPNQPDTEKYLGFFLKDETSLIKAGNQLLNELNLEGLLITRGALGMAVFQSNDKIVQIPAYNKTDVFDVTGAGDTVVATFTLSLASGFSFEESTFIANVAASIVIRRFGCSTTSISELKCHIDKMIEGNSKEILNERKF